MNTPARIQRKRRRGWRAPAGATYVGRPSKWGNPFRISRSSDFHGLPGSWYLMDDQGAMYHPDHDTESSARQMAVDLFAERVREQRDTPLSHALIRAELAGRDLVCWCPRNEPCHADVLLRIANSPTETTAAVCPGCGRALPAAGRDVEAVVVTTPAVRLSASPTTCPECAQ